jgi:hypothetical protein
LHGDGYVFNIQYFILMIFKNLHCAGKGLVPFVSAFCTTRMRKLGALMIVVFLVVELAIGIPAETKQHKVLVKEYQGAIDDTARCRLLLSLGNEAEVPRSVARTSGWLIGDIDNGVQHG